MDLSCPMRIKALGPDGREEYIYSLIIVDKWTRKRWDIPLADKTEVPAALLQWIITSNAHCVNKVKRLHSDNGTEFASKAVKAICDEFHISQTFAVTYEPRQNPYVEHSIGITTPLARAMLATSMAPIKLWWFTRNYTTEIVNIFGMSRDFSPDELFYQTVLDASLFYPFGCHCWAWMNRKLA